MPKDFIDLKEKPESISVAPDRPKQVPRGPSLYISGRGIELPLDEDDLNKERAAEIKYKLRRVATSTENGRTENTYNLEITEIKFA